MLYRGTRVFESHLGLIKTKAEIITKNRKSLNIEFKTLFSSKKFYRVIPSNVIGVKIIPHINTIDIDVYVGDFNGERHIERHTIKNLLYGTYLENKVKVD